MNQTALVDAKVLTSCATILSWTNRELQAKGFVAETEDLRRLRAGTMELLLALLEGTPSAGRSETVTSVNASSNGDSGRALPTATSNIAASMVTTLDIRSIKKRLGRIYRRYVRSILPELASKKRVSSSATEKDVELSVLDLEQDAFSGPLNEGFNIIILLSQLAERVPTMRDMLLDVQSFEPEDQNAVRFFTDNLNRVEIARNNELHRVYFPRPGLANFLTEKTKDETLWNLPRDSPGEKVNGLFSAANDLFDEMEHQYRLRQYPIVSKLVNALPTVSTIGFVIAVLINILLLASVRVSPSESLDRVPGSELTEQVLANETASVVGGMLFCNGSDSDSGAANGTCPEAGFTEAEMEKIALAGAVPFGDEDGLTVYPLGYLNGGGVLQLVRILACIHPFLSILILITYNISFAPLIIKARWKERVAARSLRRRGHHQEREAERVKQTTIFYLLFHRGPELAFQGLERARHLAEQRAAKAQDGSGDAVPADAHGTAAPAAAFGDEDGASTDPHVQRRGVTELSGMDIKTPSQLEVMVFYCTYWGFCVFDAVRDNSIMYLIGYFICSWLGYAKNEFFFAYHLGDVVIRNETVKSVLRAVVHNGKQLMMTSLLCSVIVYVYSILGFWAFRDQYVLETPDGGVDHMCDNVLDCFLFTLHQVRACQPVRALC